MSEYKLADIHGFIPKPIQTFHTQKNDFTSDPSTEKLFEDNELGMWSM